VKKRLDINLLQPTLKYAKEFGISVTTSFITGFPSETFSDLEATLNCLDSCLRISPTTTSLQLHLLTPEPGTALYEENENQLLYDGHISDFNFPTLAEDESALLRGNPDIFMNHHFYGTKLPRETFVGVTTVFAYLGALGGPLLQAVMECLEMTLSSLLFTILSRCEKNGVTYQRAFGELLSLINERRAGCKLIRRLVDYAFAHLRARHSGSAINMKPAPNGSKGVICIARGATLFRNAFDIPSVFERIQNRVGAWRTISTRSTAHNFVVYRSQTGGCESKALQVGDNIGIILELLAKPRRKKWILRKFPAADAEAASYAIDDLLERGVLRVCA
jgi:hypothetical protein